MSYTRREFLKASFGASTLLSLSPAVPAFLTRSARGAAPRPGNGETVLVVVQLSGGNDGLNTVVPYSDERYIESRPTLSAVARRVHKIDSLLGFHPRMQGFKRLYDEGRLSVVQGVGYPNASRNHDTAMRHWHTARPEDENCQSGWLGRTVDHVNRPGEAGVPAIFVGPIQRPFALNAAAAIVPAVRSLRECTLHTLPGSAGQTYRQRLIRLAELPRPEPDDPLVHFVQRSTLAAYAASRQIEAIAQAQTASQGAQYPPSPLAKDLQTVAQLIRAEVGIRIYLSELGGGGIGGFDNHANQLGNHCALLGQLSDAVAAFVDDLAGDRLLDRVLLMTFSEFGRTVRENGRRGTDHGLGAPVFLAGGKLKGGLVGPHPDLADLDAGALKFHTDFRRVYATVLDRWLGFDSRAVLGEEFKPLDVLKV